MGDRSLASADSHFVEPPDLFERYLPRRVQPHAPRMQLQTDDAGVSQHVWTFQATS